MIPLMAFLLAFGAATGAEMSVPQKAAPPSPLQRERDKLPRTNDPVARTKIEINIAKLLLGLAADAVRNGNLPQMEDHIREYLLTVEDAHQTMMKTGRDAHRKPAGFKDLEIALRGHLRLLDDIGGNLRIDERGSVDKAKATIAAIQDRLLQAMFFEDKKNATPKP